MNKIKTIILSIASGIGAFFSAVFYVLYKQAKEEKLQSKLDDTAAKNKQLEKIQETEKSEREKNEKDIQNIIGSSGADTVSYANDIMQKLSSKR